jgi:hypothetical protein
MGPGYAPGSVTWANATGQIETVIGTPTDCVHVDGSSGPCGGVPPGYTDGETPSGTVDGVNATFTLAAAPNPAASLSLYRNGMKQTVGVDYTLTANSIAFVAASAPQAGDTLTANYRVPGASTVAAQMYPNPQVLCSGLGGGTNSSTLSSIGTCTIPAGFLGAGDRVEIRFDFTHQGSAGGFTAAVQWGSSTVLSRNGSAADAQVSGHADAGLTATGATLSYQSWGTTLSFVAGVGSSTLDYTQGVTVNFLGMTALSGETVTLSNYTVVRFP